MIAAPVSSRPRSLGAPSAWNNSVPGCAHSLAERLAASGAIMTMPGVPAVKWLVGDFDFIAPNRIFWFVAFGDAKRDAHVLDFDELRHVEQLGVYFLRGGQPLGYLSTIEASRLDDPDDYHIAWQIWESVLPLRRCFIAGCRESLMTDHN